MTTASPLDALKLGHPSKGGSSTLHRRISDLDFRSIRVEEILNYLDKFCHNVALEKQHGGFATFVGFNEVLW
ncbi:MAG TPA: hypothetical protein ENI07_14415 [Desulfobacterales bacterium]|nr:hypothetical protein [Desulfobacterales bacterium]